MADSTVQIKLVTTADASGADKINAALGITSQREKELAAMRAQFLTHAEAERIKVNQLVVSAKELAAARAAEIEAAKRRPLLADGIDRERAEVEKLITAQKQLAAERNKPAAAANPWASGGQSFNSRSPVFLQQLNDFDKAQTRVTGSSRNMGNALLQASRGIQDMQYGLAGAVNNLEGIASALGLGAGVAGVVTVLAVILQQTGPKILEFFKSLDSSKIKTDGIDALIAQLGKAPEVMSAAERSAQKFETQTGANDEAMKRLNEQLENNLKLLSLQAAAQRSQADFETEQAVQDIKVQKLDPAAEAAAIANAKTRGAERQKQIADEEAIAKLNTAANQRDAAQNAADAARARAENEERLLRNTDRMNDLLKEQKRLQEELVTAREVAAMSATGSGMVDPAAKRRVEETESAIAANEAAQKNVGPIGIKEALTKTAPAAREEATQKRAEADKAARDAAQLAAEESLKAEERARELDRKREEINRAAAPGVYGPNLVAPAAPFGPAPLPTGTPARRFAPGEMPPNPFGLPQPLPSGGGFNAQPAAPFGPAPLPSAPPVNTKPIEQAAAKNDEANAAVMKFAEATVKQNEVLVRKMNLLEERMKNSRVT